MSAENIDDLSEEDRRRIAAVHLMRYFNYCLMAHAEDREPGSVDDMGPVAGHAELEDMIETVSLVTTGDTGERAEKITMRTFEALADMIAHQGADLENLMRMIILKQEQKMVIIRLKA